MVDLAPASSSSEPERGQHTASHTHTPGSHTHSEDPPGSPHRLGGGRSFSSLAVSGSLSQLNKEPTPSIASDISNPYATQELQQRLEQLHK